MGWYNRYIDVNLSKRVAIILFHTRWNGSWVQKVLEIRVIRLKVPRDRVMDGWMEVGRHREKKEVLYCWIYVGGIRASNNNMYMPCVYMRRLQNDLGGFLADKKNCHNLQPSSSSSPSIYQIYLYTNIFIYILPNTSWYYVYLPLLLLLSWAVEYICLLCLWNLHLFATVCCGVAWERSEPKDNTGSGGGGGDDGYDLRMWRMCSMMY